MPFNISKMVLHISLSFFVFWSISFVRIEINTGKYIYVFTQISIGRYAFKILRNEQQGLFNYFEEKYSQTYDIYLGIKFKFVIRGLSAVQIKCNKLYPPKQEPSLINLRLYSFVLILLGNFRFLCI